MLSVTSGFPNIAETTGSNGTLADQIYSVSGDGVRDGDTLVVATEPPEPLGDAGMKGAVPQDLYNVSIIRTLV